MSAISPAFAALDPVNTDSFTAAVTDHALSPIADYEFGTGGNIGNLSQLSALFNPYGIAGTTVINQEWERYQTFNSSNFVFTATTLDLTATIPSGGGLFSGGINSGQIWTKATFVPARKANTSTANNYPVYAFEIEMKLPPGQGMWPASWFYAEYPSGDTITPNGSDGSEIDNPEFFTMNGQNTTDWTGNNHGPNVGASIYDLRNSGGVYNAIGTDYSAGYHLYQTYWTTDAVYKYLDGVLIYADHFTWSSGSDAQFGANLACGSNLSGLPGLQPTSLSEFPAALSIKHIKIWGGTGTSNAPTCDLNADGKVNVSDVQAAVNQALGVATCSTANLQQTTPPTCNAIDVQRVVNAALGGACVTGP